MSFSTTFGELFLVYSLGKYTRFLVTHPLLAWGWGQKIGQICGVFSSKDSKNAHFFDLFLNGYIHLTTSKTKNKPLGLCPKPHSHLRGRRGRWQTLSTYPTVSVGSFKASRVKCDFVALDPSPSPWG